MKLFRQSPVRLIQSNYGISCSLQFRIAPYGCENIIFFNGQLFKEVYMPQLEGFEVEGKQHKV